MAKKTPAKGVASGNRAKKAVAGKRAGKQAKKAAPSTASSARRAAARSTKPTKAAKPAKASKPARKAPPPAKPRVAKARPDRPARAVATKAPAAPAVVRLKKNASGLTRRDLEHFRELLLEKRRELLGDLSSMEREALRSSGTNLSNLPVHMADMGTDNYEQEFTLGLVEKDRMLLREINAALARIQDGTYGICEGTGKPIGKPRLEAQPWARYSIEHMRHMEKSRVFR